MSKITLVKVLFVLAYAQMLVQQMENRHNLEGQAGLFGGYADDEGPYGLSSGCCNGGAKELISVRDYLESSLSGVGNWLACMWTSARTCSAALAREEQLRGTSRAARLLDAAVTFSSQLLGTLLGSLGYLYDRLLATPTLLAAVQALWLTRWRSPIIQRLMQSVFVQIYYTCSLVFAPEAPDEAAEVFS